MKFEINSIDDLQKVINYIKPKLKENVCLKLNGQMGAGKTTFTKLLLKDMGIKEIVNSPTFTIMNQYKLNNLCINHIDAYRLTKNDELEMYLEQMIGSLNIIEWSENLSLNYQNYFKVTNIDIEILGESQRTFIVGEE